MERISFNEIPQNLYATLMSLEKLIRDSSLDYQLLEIMRLRVAQLNRCAYCVDMHYKELRHLGETELRLSSLCVWRKTNYFSIREQAVLNFTEALLLDDNDWIRNEIYDELLAYFNKSEVCFLTVVVAQISTWTRLMKVTQITPGNYVVQHN